MNSKKLILILSVLVIEIITLTVPQNGLGALAPGLGKTQKTHMILAYRNLLEFFSTSPSRLDGNLRIESLHPEQQKRLALNLCESSKNALLNLEKAQLPTGDPRESRLHAVQSSLGAIECNQINVKQMRTNIDLALKAHREILNLIKM